MSPNYADYLEEAAQADFLVEFFDGEPYLDDGSWRYTAAEAGERLALRALGIELAVDEVYEGVELKPRLKLPR